MMQKAALWDQVITGDNKIFSIVVKFLRLSMGIVADGVQLDNKLLVLSCILLRQLSSI